MWVVHLPVAYPWLRLTADGPSSSDPDFAEAIWTVPVHQATQALGSFWWIAGRDLITVRRRSDPSGQKTFSAEEVVAVAAALVALARSFPPDLPARFGSTATTDVPLPLPTR